MDGQVCSTGFCVLRPGPEVLTDWVFYGALSDDFVGQLTSKMRGATYPGVSDRDVLTSVLPIPPLAEQRRIVARIRECTERIDEARRLRQASLAEAAALAQAARFEAFGVSARRAPLASLIATGPDNGLYKHSKHYGTGTPILRINNFGCGDVLRGGIVLKRVRLDPGEGEHFLLRSGDIVVNRVNGSLDVVGKACLIASLDEDTVFESNMMRFAPDARKADPRYVLHFLASPQCREQIRQKARVIQQASINQKDVCGLEIPVPGLAEQRRIADSLDVTVECAARLLAELDDGQSELDPLRAAVLRKAFAGEL
ncbi:MAG: restriction endonuclease subunit S [Deltaproteobacteria bacterium]|nr:restriction endonuclease subunit S [Deltaproteobacteria bacterium]